MQFAGVLQLLGIDTNDSNFDDTPMRVAEWLIEYQAKKGVGLEDILTPRFKEEHKELVLVKDISFTALCAHHMLPFVGRAAVGYIPDGTVVGLSKLVRATRFFAERLTLQERITQELADGIMNVLAPKGVMVVIEADHMCMQIRGVRDPHVKTTTSAVRGVFLDNTLNSRDEFLALLRG